MKIKRLPVAVLALVAAVIMLAGMDRAPAQVDIQIGGGPPPPPPPHWHRGPEWVRPYPGAVWIHGENVWREGRWVWVGGYWTYPPFPGAVYVYGHYHFQHWRPGHWAR